jgi:Tfp pilus assembly protein PilX
MAKTHRVNEQGAVSLFVVIFAALLMTILTVSFIQLMLRDQQQATTSDLSQSAYDSAQAGVEDAKRLLILNQSCKSGAASSNVDCNKVYQALTPPNGSNETNCDTLSAAGLVGETDGETKIQANTNAGDLKLDQAYTCVKIATDTDDYKGTLTAGQSIVVPIRGTSAFDTVELSWFSREDLSNPNNVTAKTPLGGSIELPPVGSWDKDWPSLLRAQLIQTGASFSLDQFDTSQADKSNTNTLFLYPNNVATANNQYNFGVNDLRRSPLNAPKLIRCETNLSQFAYSCTATLKLPASIDGQTGTNRNAYLHLGALYNDSHFQIKLKQGSTPVRFDSVQPIVDSTGRANDVFRRVQARVQLSSDYTYPDAAIDLQGDLCKNFTITNDNSGYSNSATCTP